MVGGDGFEPPYPEGTDLQSAAFNHSATRPHLVFILLKNLAGPQGFEPQLTESKSVVLPLHYGPMSHYVIHYTTYCILVNLTILVYAYILINQIQHYLKTLQDVDANNHNIYDLTSYPLIL